MEGAVTHLHGCLTMSYFGGIPDFSSKLAPGPLPDSPIFDSPIGLDPIDSLGDGSLAGLADAG